MNMNNSSIQDYQILQRNAAGYAHVSYSGTYERAIGLEDRLFARVMREEDNLVVIPFTACELTRDEEKTIWKTEFDLPEGGLYRFECVLKTPALSSLEWANKIDCKYHVGVGDVWIMAGQSNMTGYARDNTYDPPELGVHLFMRRGTWNVACHPLCDSIGSPYGYEEGATGTSPALSFARKLHRELNIPIGLVPAAIGGTPISAWNRKGGGCYDKMMAMLADVGAVRGMIWFQGCNDCNPKDCVTYFDDFETGVKLWRETIRPDLPIVTAQLNRWMGNNNDENDRCWGEVRDAQRRAAMTIPDVWIVPTTDYSVTDGIHDNSAGNVGIGERMAYTAMAAVYGKVGRLAPLMTSVTYVDDTHVRVQFTGAHLRMRVMDGVPLGTDVEDGQGLIECVHADNQGEDVLVFTTARPFARPAKFHYAWRKHPPLFPIRDINGMPMLSCYGVEIQ